MKPSGMDITTLWAELAIEELVRSGVRLFIISPGSRSTPLALAAGRNRRAEIVTHFDERGAGFVAVGYARANGIPAALICTSGTAVANYLPSVVEASMDHLPLIVLSADRPPELQGTGANQTIPQKKIFGKFVRWESSVPCPTEAIQAVSVLTTIDQAVCHATGQNAGPVHLNFHFREPLVPDPAKSVSGAYLQSVDEWMTSEVAFTTHSPKETGLSDAEIGGLASMIAGAKSGVIVVGRLRQRQQELHAIAELSRKLGWPVVSDIGSGLRLGCDIENHLAHFDLLLLDKSKAPTVDCILHLGGPLVSKRVTEFLAAHKGEYIVVNHTACQYDPGQVVTRRIQTDLTQFANGLLARVESGRASDQSTQRKCDQIISDVLTDEIDNGEFAEPVVARIIARAVSSECALFLASSLTVRDFDMYAPQDGALVPVGCNRGASGIDGTVASAVGFARGLKRPVTLVIGDTALLHDLNSLALVNSPGTPPITIVCVNNGGGAIFSMLSIAERPEIVDTKTLESLFVQQHSLTFESAAKMFGLPYFSSQDSKSFSRAYQDAIAGRTASLIEVSFDWRLSRTARLNLRERIIAALQKG